MPSGPGADFLFDFARMLLMSRGLNGAVLNCVKSSESPDSPESSDSPESPDSSESPNVQE